MVKQLLDEGLRLYREGRKDAAAKTYRFALKQDPSSDVAWSMLGVLTNEGGALDEAIVMMRKALELKPSDARHHHNLAGLLTLDGELDEALSLFRRAIEIDPTYAEAYFNISAVVKAEPGEPLLAAVDKLLARPGLSNEDLLFLNFAAGKFRDDLGDHDRAFGHYRDANAAKQATFLPEQTQRKFDAAAATFDADLIARRQAAGSGSDLPVFVVGMPRTGTSLVEQILASHPDVHGAGELPDLNWLTGSLAKHHPKGTPYPEAARDVPDAVLQAFANQYVGVLSAKAPEARRVVDKHPLNFRYLGLIAILFPGARIIHCRRHPLDTCLSCYFQNFTNGQEYSFDLYHLGLFYRFYRRLMAHWASVMPNRILEVDYEDLVGDADRLSRRMIAFLGLDWHPDCLDFHRTRRPVKTGSRWQVRQPIYRRSTERWRRYERHLAPLKEALGPVLEET